MTVSRVLALPAKGEPQRKTAMLGYGMLASAIAYGGALGISQNPHTPTARSRPAATVPDVDQEEGDVYRSKPEEGYVPTYFDGRGGIAGVPLTDEQRQAVMKEAIRRGLSKEDARALAYGEDDEFTKPAQPVRPDAGKQGDGDTQVLASGPLYREVAPTEESESAGSGSRAQGKTPSERGSQGKQPKEPSGDPGKSEEKPKGKLGDVVHEVVPDPVEDLVDTLTPFRSYMVAISQPGTEPTFDVSEPDAEGIVTVTAESQVTDSMTVTVEVTAPVGATPDAPPCVVSVTVTDPQTDEVTVPTDTETVDSAGEVPRVAIGEVVEAVVSAPEGDSSLSAGEGRE
ncbi:hypothetical protein OG824_18480 [Streptomyces prunicolor]|uniref:hypothetical protein n=1 Tax=Streptomyces prunicolor TaxID=67348 RepID=UPI0022567D85|nr:hypothetical protein [Streptomyces prunicolor]MCX5237188.1 hypothetical protein [Streptomyces prunicolor]